MSNSELLEKFGSLIQYGVGYMANFNTFANTFIAKYYEYKPEIDREGYSAAYNAWRTLNAEQIIELYDALDAEGLIPAAPTE